MPAEVIEAYHAHAKSRAKKRYGLVLSDADLAAIEGLIARAPSRDCYLVRSTLKENYRSLYAVRFQACTLLAVYDHPTASVVSFLPGNILKRHKRFMVGMPATPKEPKEYKVIRVKVPTGCIVLDGKQIITEPDRIPEIALARLPELYPFELGKTDDHEKFRVSLCVRLAAVQERLRNLKKDDPRRPFVVEERERLSSLIAALKHSAALRPVPQGAGRFAAPPVLLTFLPHVPRFA